MPGTAYITSTVPGGVAPQFAYRRIDQGELQGLALIPITEDIHYGQVYATVGIMRGGEGTEFIVAVFLDDYVSQNHMPNYGGNYTFTTQDILFLRLITPTAVTIRLAATVYRTDEN